MLPVKDLIYRINDEPDAAEVTGSDARSEDAFALLKAVPVKYLRYAEDVRPPYIGTYTKQPVGHSIRRMCRKPFTRALPKINYDYDSEVEWEEPEEGDNCESDEEDSEQEDDDDDMDGFLDDDEDAPKRRNVMGDMEPVSTGIIWQDADRGRGAVKVPFGTITLNLDPFRLSPLLVEAIGPIDPFSTNYWKAPDPVTTSADVATMGPPRAPLNTLLSANTRLAVDPTAGLSLKPPPIAPAGSVSGAPKAKTSAKPFPPELIDEFKREIDGSDLSKIGLVEVLKKR